VGGLRNGREISSSHRLVKRFRDLTVGDFVKGEVLLEEHREILTDVGFDGAEATVRA
jgi:hypothetical protein